MIGWLVRDDDGEERCAFQVAKLLQPYVSMRGATEKNWTLEYRIL